MIFRLVNYCYFSLKFFKKRKVAGLFFTVLSFCIFNTQANAEAQSSCTAMNSSYEIVQCALRLHPDTLRAESSLRQGGGLEAVARQRPNPELSSRALFGRSSGEAVNATEVNLAHVFELGGKRDARIQRAIAEKDIRSTNILKLKEEIYLSTILNLYRLRQAKDELSILDEAHATFNQIQKVYKSRPTLNPEQKVSVGVFQLAAGENELRKTVLESEIRTLIRSIGFAIGGTFVPTEKLLPVARTFWPVLVKNSFEVSGAAIKIARSELRLANSEYSVEKSNTWPDMRLGPSVEFQKVGAVSEVQYGLNLTIPLPIYQSNQAGKAYASQGVERAQQNLRLTENAFTLERVTLIENYEATVAALKKATALSDIEKRHKSVENLFDRGLVTSALVIESHRQIFDFTKSQHEQELTALEALVKVYAIEGRLLEEKL